MRMIVTVDDLRRMRMNAGISQIELADEVGVSQAFIARMEKGSLDPKLSLVHKIIRYLTGVTMKVCSEIMSTDVVTVDARDPVLEAARKMRNGSFSQLPVLRGTRLLGSISQDDIIRNLNLNLVEMNVDAIMNPEGIPMVSENTPVEKIIPLLQVFQAVIVQRQGRLSGIITSSDLLKQIRDGILVL